MARPKGAAKAKATASAAAAKKAKTRANRRKRSRSKGPRSRRAAKAGATEVLSRYVIAINADGTVTGSKVV